MNQVVSSRARRLIGSALVAAAGLGLPVTASLSAQEALRYSLAGQDMAEARKRQLSDQKFNVKLGPVAMRFSGQMGVEVTDNVKYVEDDRVADLIIRPQLNIFSVWRVTERNSLTLGLGVGYEKYLETTDYDNLLITPDTDLSFDVYAGDFLINFHDRFDYGQDVSSDPTVSGTGSLNRFENTAGLLVTWDLNKAFVATGYDHRNFIATQSQYEYLTHTAELFTGRVGFHVRPTVDAGIEVGGGLIDYELQINQDNQHIGLGPYAAAELNQYTQVRLSGGYVIYALDTYGRTNFTSQVDGFYFDLSLRQRLGNLLSHTLSAGRSVQASVASELVDLWRIQHGANWNLFRQTSLSTIISYEHGTENGTFGETLDRYGFGFTFGRTLTKHMHGSLGYQFYYKDSDVAGRDYVQNRLVLNVVYTF